MTWTDDRIERLKQLWADGLSASVIAAELGGISRNGVIGKVHRLRLTRSNGWENAHVRHRKPKGKPANPEQQMTIAPAKPASAVPAQPTGEAAAIPIGQRCSILELGEGKCRWPIGAPGAQDFFFCGCMTIKGLPYCGYHARLAYRPQAEDRRRTKAA